MKPSLVFWYEFSSTYSYLTAMRIGAAAKQAGVGIVWRPFLLGPIFKAQGWTTSPFNLFPAKGRYMVRDIGRTAAERGIAFGLPSPFPFSSIKAARLALAIREADGIAAFAPMVFDAAFAKGLDVTDDGVLRDCLAAAGVGVEAAFERGMSDEIKAALRRNTDDAQAAGIFGAPSFTTADGELFWGDDRLDATLMWAKEHEKPH